MGWSGRREDDHPRDTGLGSLVSASGWIAAAGHLLRRLLGENEGSAPGRIELSARALDRFISLEMNTMQQVPGANRGERRIKKPA